MTSIVMRAHNDMPIVAETLAVLEAQDSPWDLYVFDNASTDGTLEEARRHTDNIFHVPAGGYIPGEVLNRGMEVTSGEVVVFLNSDCTPLHRGWLRALIAPFRDEAVGTVFGRQVARPGCNLLEAKDTEDTYGSGERHGRWRQCFSMASSAVRRSVWGEVRFDERLRISEDIDFAKRVRESGHDVRYVPDSIVLHSHDYTLRQWFRRQYKEGRDEGLIFDLQGWDRSLLRYSLLPLAKQVISDWRFCLRRGGVADALQSPMRRLAQMVARRGGLRKALRERRNGR